MKQYLNRFEAWAIGLKHDPFNWARIKLIFFYTIIIVGALIFYLILLYKEFNRDILLFAKENIQDTTRRERFVNRSLIVAKTTLFTVEPEDVMMFFISIGISYSLATIALRPIKKSMQVQKQFLADASHELKTPLTNIKTEMEIFLHDRNNWIDNKGLMLRKRQAVESNLEEIDRMQQIIDSLLALSHVDTFQEKFIFSSIYIHDMLLRLVKQTKESAKKKHIQISLLINEPLYVSADAVRLEQALLNIVRNAIKYTKSGGKVQISAQRNNRRVEIAIIDTGIGIAKKDLPHITERFFRSNTEFTKRVGGTGLGLAIASMIIKKHRGDIHIQSSLGKGTTITVSLPLLHPSHPS